MTIFQDVNIEQKHPFLVLPTQVTPCQYEETNGFAEVKIVVLVFLLGFNYTDVFLLVTNLKGADTFDIIIFLL
jgi:hypothetical protein